MHTVFFKALIWVYPKESAVCKYWIVSDLKHFLSAELIIYFINRYYLCCKYPKPVIIQYLYTEANCWIQHSADDWCQFLIKLEILKSLGGFYDGLASLPRRIAMQPSLMLKIWYKSVQKGERYHLYKNVEVGCTKRGGNIFQHLFYILLITLVSGQIAENFVEIRS